MDELISKEVVIDTLKAVRDLVWEVDIPSPTVPEYIEHHEQMQSIMRNIDILTDKIIKMPSVQPEWIPCSEELPDEDHLTGAGVQYSDYVLMTVFNEEDDETVIDYGYLRDGEWYSVNADRIIPNWWKVTAWMPLPEPEL